MLVFYTMRQVNDYFKSQHVYLFFTLYLKMLDHILLCYVVPPNASMELAVIEWLIYSGSGKY